MMELKDTIESPINKICRTCLSGDQPLLELFSPNCMIADGKLTLCDILLTVAYLQISTGDGLPEEICQSCAEKANMAYNFRVLCERSDAVLREASLSEQCVKLEGVIQQALLPSGPMLLVSPNGVRVVPKSEIEAHNTLLEAHDKMDSTVDYEELIVEEFTIRCDPEGDTQTYQLTPVQEAPRQTIVKRLPKRKKLNTPKKSTVLDSDMTDDEEEVSDGLEYSVARDPEVFTCVICSESFTDRAELRAHKKTHPPDMRHSCKICEKTFSSIYTLQHHLITHTENKAHLCPVCGKRFHLAGGLRQHLNCHRRIKLHSCALCEKRYCNMYLLREHIRCAHSDNRYNNTCSVCGKKFTAKSTLTSHMKIHTGEKPYPCDVCGKRFTRPAYLREHSRLHTQEPPVRVFKCDHDNCNRVFTAKASLQIHIRHRHTHERPYCCDVCPKTFSSQPGLAEHRRVHTGEKPEECELCERRFVNKQSLKKHMRLHTGERPYPCSHCTERFSSSSRRNEHVQTKHMEPQYECRVCSKRFHLRRAFNLHLHVHSGDRQSRQSKTRCAKVTVLETKQTVPEPGFEVIV